MKSKVVCSILLGLLGTAVFWLKNESLSQHLSRFSPVLVHSTAIRVIEFSTGVYKIGKIFAYKSTYQRKLLNFEYCVNGEMFFVIGIFW